MNKGVVILANGKFPEGNIALGYLNTAYRIICCDGAVIKLINFGLEPWAIVGDLDSVPDDIRKRFSDRLFASGDQDTNDLTKAVKHCLVNGLSDVVILGATGLREDHTLGNISLLADYAESLSVKMVTDHGIIIPVKSGTGISSWPGQQVSIFSIDRGTRITSDGLKYPLRKKEFKNLWMGTLNECTEDTFILFFDKGRILVYLNMMDFPD